MKQIIITSLLFVMPFAIANEGKYSALGCDIDLKNGYKINEYPKENRTVVVSPKDGGVIEVGKLPFPNSNNMKLIEKKNYNNITISNLSNLSPKETMYITVVSDSNKYMSLIPTKRNKHFANKIVASCLKSAWQ